MKIVFCVLFTIAFAALCQASSVCYKVGVVKTSCSASEPTTVFKSIPGPVGPPGKDGKSCDSTTVCSSFKKELDLLKVQFKQYQEKFLVLFKEVSKSKLQFKEFQEFQRKVTVLLKRPGPTVLRPRPPGPVPMTIPLRPAVVTPSPLKPGKKGFGIYKVYNYETYSDAKNWWDAREFCISKGGDIAFNIVKTTTDRKNLFKAIGVPTNVDYWIGANDNFVEGSWVYPDGSNVNSNTFGWLNRVPTGGANRNCAVAKKTSLAASTSACHLKRAFICEIPLAKRLVFRDFVVHKEQTWVGARDYCKKKGGSLAHDRVATLESRLKTLAAAGACNHCPYHLGFRYTNGKWKSVTGQSVPTNFGWYGNLGNPSDAHKCASTMPKHRGLVEAASCDHDHGIFVCQKS